MSDFARYRTELLDEPLQPHAGRSDLAISGCSVLTYCLARADASTTGALRSACDAAVQATYGGVYWDSGLFELTPLRPLGTVDLGSARWTGEQSAVAQTHYLWATPNHVLAITAWRLSEAQIGASRFEGGIPLRDSSIGTVLAAIRTLSEPTLLHRIAKLVADDLGIPPTDVTPVPDALAIDVWDLAGSAMLGDPPEFKAPDHVPRAAYEISALLSRTTSHIIDDGRWAEQDPDRVAVELRYAYSFLTAGAAFANSHTCVEISDVVHTRFPEYRNRLRLVGYDSTAIFVWNMEVLRSAVIRELNTAYRLRIARLLDGTLDEPTDLGSVNDRITTDTAATEVLGELPRQLREGRHRAMSEDVSSLRSSHDDLDALCRRIASYDTMTKTMRQSQIARRTARINLILSIFGAAIAIAGLTQIGELIYSWYRGGDITRPLITLALIAAAAASTFVVWRHMARDMDQAAPEKS